MDPCKKKPWESSNDRKKILLVDDNWIVGNVECKILEHLGYQVDFQTDPMEALDHFHRKGFDFNLIITDMDMPIMTGDRLALEIVKLRKKHTHCHVYGIRHQFFQGRGRANGHQGRDHETRYGK